MNDKFKTRLLLFAAMSFHLISLFGGTDTDFICAAVFYAAALLSIKE